MFSKQRSVQCLVCCVTSTILSNPSTRDVGAEPPPLAAHPANVWIKRTPLPDAPVSPRLGYEGRVFGIGGSNCS